jgi:SAM-dependent methyltransferase
LKVRVTSARLLRRVIPHASRPTLRAFYNRLTWRLYTGNRVSCNCCQGNFRRFRIHVGREGHRSLMCPRCGSLGRHRVDWLFLTEHTDALKRAHRLLHIAPEVCLESPIRRLAQIDYRSADYDSKLAMEHVDATAMHYESESFDAVICNHVLVVIEDDKAAMVELHRVLKPGGWALLQATVDTARERAIERARPARGARYEEFVLRQYGRDYVAQLEQVGFSVTVSEFVRALPVAVQERFGLDPGETIFFCRKPADAGAAFEEASDVRPREARAESETAARS